MKDFYIESNGYNKSTLNSMYPFNSFRFYFTFFILTSFINS